MKNPKFSVVIPAYNHEKYINDCIQSVLSQTLQDFEIVIINDGSTDNTEKVVNSFNDARIRYFKQKNHDAPFTINRGIHEARGQYIAILNSDDVFEKEKLQNCLEVLNNGKDFVFGKVRIIDEKNRAINNDDQRVRWINERLNDSSNEDITLHKLLLNINYFVTTSNFVFRKDVVDKVGYFHEKLHYSHDFDFLLKLYVNEIKIGFIPTYMCSYRMHSDNTIIKGKAESILEVSYSIAKILFDKKYNIKISEDFYTVPVISNILSYFVSIDNDSMENIINNKEDEGRRRILGVIKYWQNWEEKIEIQKKNKSIGQKNQEIISIVDNEQQEIFNKLIRIFDFIFPHASIRRKLLRMSYKLLRTFYRKIRSIYNNYKSARITSEVEIYKNLLEFFKDRNFVFFGPWVAMGGADKLMIEYSDALKNSNFNPCLITTIKSGERINQIQIPHLDLNESFTEWDSFDIEKKLHILLKALINSGVKVIHVIQSDLALQLVKHYSKLFKEHNIKVIVSLFNPNYDEKTKTYGGYPVMYPEVMRNSDIILSDNKCWYDLYKELAGQDFNYKKLYTPADLHPTIKETFSNNKKILWASRICNQKLIDVLYEICKRMPDLTFVIYGGEPEESLAKEYFEKILNLKNVEYRGIYNDVSELNMDEFDLFLFTSKFEGLAIVRIDMASANMPIISSDVGDSLEIFGNNYELLVKQVENVDEYCQKIEKFYKDPQYYFDKMTLIRKNVIAQYNIKKFQEEYIDSIKSLTEKV